MWVLRFCFIKQKHESPIFSLTAWLSCANRKYWLHFILKDVIRFVRQVLTKTNTCKQKFTSKSRNKYFIKFISDFETQCSDVLLLSLHQEKNSSVHHYTLPIDENMLSHQKYPVQLGIPQKYRTVISWNFVIITFNLPQITRICNVFDGVADLGDHLVFRYILPKHSVALIW